MMLSKERYPQYQHPHPDIIVMIFATFFQVISSEAIPSHPVHEFV